MVFGNYVQLVLRTFLSVSPGLQELLWNIDQGTVLQLYWIMPNPFSDAVMLSPTIIPTFNIFGL